MTDGVRSTRHAGRMLRQQELPVSLSTSAPTGAGRARWRTAVAGVLAKSSPGANRPNSGPNPSGCSTPPPTKASRSGRSTPRSTSCRNRRCPATGPSSAVATPIRDVIPGWKVAEAFPAPGATGRRATAMRRCWTRSPTGSARCCSGSGSPAWRRQLDRLLEGVYLSWRRSSSMPAPTTRRPATRCWRWWPRRNPTSAQRCRSTWAPTR